MISSDLKFNSFRCVNCKWVQYGNLILISFIKRLIKKYSIHLTPIFKSSQISLQEIQMMARICNFVVENQAYFYVTCDYYCLVLIYLILLCLSYNGIYPAIKYNVYVYIFSLNIINIFYYFLTNMKIVTRSHY